MTVFVLSFYAARCVDAAVVDTRAHAKEEGREKEGERPSERESKQGGQNKKGGEREMARNWRCV